nr:MAG TPA: hypothetical protein [Caudoviricetes sp.]
MYSSGAAYKCIKKLGTSSTLSPGFIILLSIRYYLN